MAAPRRISIKILKNQADLADQCHVAESFLVRLKGLIGKRALDAGEGMLFPRCNSVHMWFMSIPIDVVFVKRDGARLIVTSARERVPPWKWLPVSDWAASETLELPAGTVAASGLREGDELCIN